MQVRCTSKTHHSCRGFGQFLADWLGLCQASKMACWAKCRMREKVKLSPAGNLERTLCTFQFLPFKLCQRDASFSVLSRLPKADHWHFA